LLSVAGAAQDGNRVALPDLGASASGVLSPQEEEAYAQALLRQMRAYTVLVEDPLVNEFFADMGYRLVAQSDHPDKNFHFVVLNEPVINAFAAPGGVVALYAGMIMAAENEDEVAGVLAHEVAHVTQMHLFRAFERARSMTIPLALAMLGMVLAGGASGEAIQGAVISGQAMAQQAQINFTRQNEYEADRIGIQTLHLAGYDPDGMAGMFAKLGRVNRPNGEGPPEYLRTHPLSTSRVAEAEARAHQLESRKQGDGRVFYLVQARVRALLEKRPQDAIDHFEHVLDLPGTGEFQREGAEYGLAIAQQRRGRYEQAAGLLEKLAEKRPRELAFQLQLADLELERGDAEAALDRLGGLYHSFPGNHAIAVEYAEVLIAQNDESKAETAAVILRQQLLGHPNNPALYALYGRAANAAGDPVRATEAIAESYYQRGGIHEAVVQLENLARRDDLDYYERARVTARLTELRIQLVEAGQAHRG
ncbi:MAG: M48 family metalloprotease, partial [Xanthomonadales bacterium]|nr:M48 family metalloprotease [Xanthomonadales bacterium]